MKKLVKYIGGQDKVSQKVCPLVLNKIYTVRELCEAKFNGVWKEAVYLEETSKKVKDLVFLSTLFVDVKKVDTSDIRKYTRYQILENKN